jgi:uncharacterized membrane protein
MDDSDYITESFCKERSGSMRERLERVENSVELLRDAYSKTVAQIAAIVGGITVLGIIASLVLQWISLNK